MKKWNKKSWNKFLELPLNRGYRNEYIAVLNVHGALYAKKFLKSKYPKMFGDV